MCPEYSFCVQLRFPDYSWLHLLLKCCVSVMKEPFKIVITSKHGNVIRYLHY